MDVFKVEIVDGLPNSVVKSNKADKFTDAPDALDVSDGPQVTTCGTDEAEGADDTEEPEEPDGIPVPDMDGTTPETTPGTALEAVLGADEPG